MLTGVAGSIPRDELWGEPTMQLSRSEMNKQRSDPQFDSRRPKKERHDFTATIFQLGADLINPVECCSGFSKCLDSYIEFLESSAGLSLDGSGKAALLNARYRNRVRA
jgi:hypothetical protein